MDLTVLPFRHSSVRWADDATLLRLLDQARKLKRSTANRDVLLRLDHRIARYVAELTARGVST